MVSVVTNCFSSSCFCSLQSTLYINNACVIAYFVYDVKYNPRHSPVRTTTQWYMGRSDRTSILLVCFFVSFTLTNRCFPKNNIRQKSTWLGGTRVVNDIVIITHCVIFVLRAIPRKGVENRRCSHRTKVMRPPTRIKDTNKVMNN